MKKILILCVAVLAGLLAFSGCKKVDTSGDFVLVDRVTLDQTNLSLLLGTDYTLHATLHPSNATKKGLEWSSNNTSIATVNDEGKVTANSSRTGTATITVKTQSGGKTATCTVNVVKEKVPVKGVSIVTYEEGNVVVSVDESRKFSFQLEPEGATNHNVTWRSDDETIATVDETGNVTGVKAGTANITVKTEEGGYEDTVPVKVVKPFTKITFTSPNTDSFNYDSSKKEYIYHVGETFHLVATGEPSDSDDEIELYIYKGQGSFDLDASGLVTARKTESWCQIEARSKAHPYSVIAAFNFKIAPKAESIELIPLQSECGVKVGSKRNTVCIGVGATQKFRVAVNPSSCLQKVSKTALVEDGKAIFTLRDGYLTVKVPSGATASSLGGGEIISAITLQAGGGYSEQFFFVNTKLDPYQPKVGDVINKEGKIGDGGYRGNGIFEEPVATLSKVNCIIAHLGEEHTKEDPFWANYKPSPELTDSKGNALHGIAIPVDITRLYRKDVTGGEYYYRDGDNDNFILDSHHLPNWVNTTDRKALLRSNSLKHSAYMNTCCHVYTNDGRGNSYEIIPFNFFWDSQTQKPSQDAGEKNSMPQSNYEFCNSYSTIDNGFNASSYSKEPTKGTLLSPWLLPTIADYISVFTDIPLSSVSADNNNISFSNDSRVKDKIKVLRHTLSVISNSSEDYNWPYWLANETGQNKFVQGSISSDGATFTIDKNVPHKSDSRKGYVLPIRYF